MSAVPTAAALPAPTMPPLREQPPFFFWVDVRSVSDTSDCALAAARQALYEVEVVNSRGGMVPRAS